MEVKGTSTRCREVGNLTRAWRPHFLIFANVTVVRDWLQLSTVKSTMQRAGLRAMVKRKRGEEAGSDHTYTYVDETNWLDPFVHGKEEHDAGDVWNTFHKLELRPSGRGPQLQPIRRSTLIDDR